MYYIFTFRSRTNAMKFYDAVTRDGIRASLVNTPRSAGIGCGLSVKLTDYEAAKKTFTGGYSSGGYPSFHAVYRAETVNGFIRLVKV